MNTPSSFIEYLSDRESALNSMYTFYGMKWSHKALISPETVDMHECMLFISDCLAISSLLDCAFLETYMPFVKTVIKISPSNSPLRSDVKDLHAQVR